MEGLQKVFSAIPMETKQSTSSSTEGVGYAFSTDQSRALMPRPPRQMVSVWTCSKLCAAFFVVGVVVGYSLKRRVRRWASNFLKRLKDD